MFFLETGNLFVLPPSSFQVCKKGVYSIWVLDCSIIGSNMSNCCLLKLERQFVNVRILATDCCKLTEAKGGQRCAGKQEFPYGIVVSKLIGSLSFELREKVFHVWVFNKEPVKSGRWIISLYTEYSTVVCSTSISSHRFRTSVENLLY